MDHPIPKYIIRRLYDSQAEFAVEVKSNESRISRVLHGRERLSPEEVTRWSKALDVPPEMLSKIAKPVKGGHDG